MLYWDPDPELFRIPYIDRPILWYGLFFMLGFALGFPLFVSILRRFFLQDPKYTELDILKPEELARYGKKRQTIADLLNFEILKGIVGDVSDRIKRFVEKSRCPTPKLALARLQLDQQLGSAVRGIFKCASFIADRLVVYIILATVFGARIGHFLFYEDPKTYLKNPFELLRVWEGQGLASHGAAIGIMIALVLFSYRIRSVTRKLSWIRLLDFVCIPAALCGSLIRIGNFFNQEILGSYTTLPWAVVFGHPADFSAPFPRHPVQIYESLFYLGAFILLWRLSYRRFFLLQSGRLIGLFLILVFGFRFLIEFLKEEQSQLLHATPLLNMGQILSIPMVLLGAAFLFYRKKAY